MSNNASRKENRAAAALVGAGIGVVALGAVQLLSELYKGLGELLQLHAGIGPYSGKLLVSGLAWLVSWLIAGLVVQRRSVDLRRALYVTVGLVVLGVILIYPPFIWLLER
ncbi:MAG: hypothetical protein ACOY3F_13715 [Bacillota bacterium]